MIAMVKAHSPINWENEPSFNTPINEANLNKMDSTIGVLDDRIIAQDTSKLDKSTAYTMVKDISFNENNGIFTVTRLNGSTFTIDTRLEKIAINFRYDYSTQKLIVTLIDGTTQSIDMSALVTQYEFADSATLDFTTDSNGKVTATIKSGSITEDMLQPNYLAEIKVETAKSAQSMANAKISENNAKQSELNAKESEEKALEYSNNAQPLAQSISGNNPTATNSTDGNLIYLKDAGYTEQQGGEPYFKELTVLNDGVNTNEIPCKTGDTVSVVCDKTYSAIYLKSYRNENTTLTGSLVEVKTFNNTNMINEVIDYEGTERIVISFMGGSTTDNVTVKINGSDGTTPTPDNPIHISANGDKGYFDGVLVQGYRSGINGNLVTTGASGLITNKNKIPCKENDVIVLQYEENVSSMKMAFFDENDTFISSLGESANNVSISEKEIIAPANSSYFYFNIGWNGNSQALPVADAKHICVTINGNYAIPVKTTGKNLLKAEPKTVTSNNCTFTFNEDGSITANGTNPNNWIANVELCTLKLKAGTYTMSQNLQGSTSIPYLYTIIDGEYIVLMGKTQNSFTLTEDREVTIRVGVYNNSTVTNATIYPQLELGEVATPYEPHQETTALIPVSAPFYTGDYIKVYADGTGREYRKMKRQVVSNVGSGEYYLSANNYIGLYFSRTDAKKDSKNVFSTHYANDGTTEQSENNIFTNSSGAIIICDKRFSTIAEFNTWLADNPITFLYELAQPTSTPLTKEQVAALLKLRTYKGVTCVNADGEVVMRYYVDNASGETVSMLQGMASNGGNGDVTELFKTITVSESATLPANEITSISIPIDVPSGYSIFGIKSIHNNTLELLYGFSCGDDSVSVSVKNTSELETQGSVSVSVYCVKTSAIS